VAAPGVAAPAVAASAGGCVTSVLRCTASGAR
jgi:hypothetical protein